MAPVRSADPDRMTFWDHLDVLRGTLFRSVVYLFAFSCLGFIFKGILSEIILAPSRSSFCVYRILGWDFGMDLINTEVSGQFFVHLKAALCAGLVLSFPFILYEIWKFIVPALYENEKKALRLAFTVGGALFYAGVACGYFVLLPVCLRFFVDYTISPEIANTITISSYMSMFNSMVMLVGLAFEFPTVVMVLSRLGTVSAETLKGARKYAFVAILVFSAIITPSDPFSMLILTAPLYLLYELSILLCSSGK